MIWKVVISLLSIFVVMELKVTILLIICAFSALMLLVEWHEGHPVGKN